MRPARFIGKAAPVFALALSGLFPVFALAEEPAPAPAVQPSINPEQASQWNFDTLRRYYQQITGVETPTTSEIYEWARGDLKNANSWEYKLLRIPLAGELATMEKQLNEAGAQRWECVAVMSDPDAQIFVFKRLKKSYLRALPMKELIKLVPSGGSE